MKHGIAAAPRPAHKLIAGPVHPGLQGLAMAIKLKVTQVRSGVGRSAQQNKTLEGLGLRGPHCTKVLEDTPAIRGMIRKVSHLVVVEPAD